MKKCDFSLDLKVVRHLLLTICVANEFQKNTMGVTFRTVILLSGMSVQDG